MKSECEVRQDERRKAIFELEHAACAIQELLAGIVARIKAQPLPLGADVLSTEEEVYANLRLNLEHARSEWFVEIERLRKDRDEWKEAAENGLVALRSIGKERNHPAFCDCVTCKPEHPNHRLRPAGWLPDPEPYCLAPWNWETAARWLTNHREWSVGCVYSPTFQGWKCVHVSKPVYATAGIAEEAVQMAAKLEKHRQNE
jgi:hypothetical protein